MIQLDYKLKTPEEREVLVKQIIEEANNDPQILTKQYLEKLSDYIISAIDQKGVREINTPNRMVTINKRQVSYEGLVSKFENGEDGVQSLIINDKGVRLTQKNEITEEDLAKNPDLRTLKQNIKEIEEEASRATGLRKYKLKNMIKEMRQEQYTIRDSCKYGYNACTKTSTPSISLDEHITMDPITNEPSSDGAITLFNPDHVSAILRNYAGLKIQFRDKVDTDIYYLLLQVDSLLDWIKEEEPLYYKLIIYKTEGQPNSYIQEALEKEFHIKHSVEYISSLWRNKIPNMISEKVKEDYIIWYYTHIEEGYWKTCGRCGKTKLAHQRFFSRNNTSKDGWYSICKECRRLNKHQGEK